MSFWAYENWTNARKVTLHAGHCGFCKEGRGRSGMGTNPANGRWIGPFESLEDAHAAANALPPATVSEDRCCAAPPSRRRSATRAPRVDASHVRAQAPPSTAARQARALRAAAPGLARRLTEAFMTGAIDLSARTETAQVGWEGVPEVPAVDGLREAGATELQVRLFLTLTTALDRARDAGRLWSGASALFAAAPEAFDPAYVLAHEEAVAAGLRKHGVSQRHGPDLAAWVTLAGTIAALSAGSEIRRALHEGEGDAKAILAERSGTSAAGKPLYPMIRGPKIGPMWVRMLAYPGGARLSNLMHLPVAVDVQVRRATQNLGVADTAGMLLDEARPIIQRAWRDDVAAAGASGPPGLGNTCAALDPALWFFGKYGCSHCETAATRVPATDVCSDCQAEF